MLFVQSVKVKKKNSGFKPLLLQAFFLKNIGGRMGINCGVGFLFLSPLPSSLLGGGVSYLCLSKNKALLNIVV